MNLHKVVGIYSAVLLSVAVFTGGAEYLNWVARSYVPGFALKEARKELKSSGALESAGAASYETMLQAAEHSIGAFQSLRFSWPKTPTGPMEVEYVLASAPHFNALSYLYLDSYSGKVLRKAPYEKENVSSRFYLWLLPIHLGLIGPGILGRVLVIAGALGALFLVLSGFWLYYRRKLNPIRRVVVSG